MNKKTLLLSLLIIAAIGNLSWANHEEPNSKTAAQILGNSDYLAISFGGYRQTSRDIVPTVKDLKEDLAILAAMNVKIIRTYNTQQFAHAANLLKAIRELKTENPDFEMYVMLGAWIDCENAWTASANHDAENVKGNTAEIEAAVEMANTYSDIIKVIAVGNEAMVNWATSYFVKPKIILKWVNHLQDLKKAEKMPSDIWITSSDNFAAWGGADKSYHTEDLAALAKAVDYISIHTYPFHDSHYNPIFWGVPAAEENLSKIEQIDAAMLRAKDYAMSQYQSVADYISSLGIEKTIHIGETGWATTSNSSYGATGSKAADEYKEKCYYEHMRAWTAEAGISCFFFEAFDEPWKDANNALGSENHFGLINIKNEAKYALWDMVDEGAFKGLTRGGKPITKTYNGDEKALLADISSPPSTSEIGVFEIQTVNKNFKLGEAVVADKYIITNKNIVPSENNNYSYPSEKLRLNAWEGTCHIETSLDGIVEIVTGTGDWWGAGIEIQGGGKGENLSNFSDGYLHFEIRGETKARIEVGFQTGLYSEGTLRNNFIVFSYGENYEITEDWQTFSIKIADLNKGANMEDVTGLIYFRGINNFDGKHFYVKNVYYSKE